MKLLLILLSGWVLSGCVAQPELSTDAENADAFVCPGEVRLPAALAGWFQMADDTVLMNQAIGLPGQGKLCQGQVYTTGPGTHVRVYRAWNSTNQRSRLGQWWSFTKPTGSVAAYRRQNEICYQWSPLDKLVVCTLKAGTRVVVGNGQSATCSDYLSYPSSATQQVFIPNAAAEVTDCQDYRGVFGWQ